MKQSWLGWPTVQFVQVWGISGKTRRPVLKPRKSQANQDKLITLILIYSGTQIKSFQVGVFYISVSFGMWIINFKCEAWKQAIYRLVLDSLSLVVFLFKYSLIPWIWIGQWLNSLVAIGLISKGLNFSIIFWRIIFLVGGFGWR